jgi:type I restriction enzyme S subunit
MKQGWEIKKLEEVCELSAGGDVPKGDFSETQSEQHQIPIYANGEKNDGLYGFTNIAKVVKPSITVSARGTIGYSVKRLEPFFPIVRLIVVTPKDISNLGLDYLDYAIKTIDFKHSGTSIPQLTVPMISNYKIPTPPLPEQQRIVSILDEAFAAIDKAKANAEQNLRNAKELFESYLQRVFEKKGDGWEEKTLGEIAFVKSGGTPLRHKTEYWSGDIAWYSSGELNDLYTTDPERHINELAIENSNSKLFPKGSLLIGMYDTAALKMSILDRDGSFNQAIAGVKPNPKIDLIFILHTINAIKPEILNLRRGVRQKNLSLEKIKNIPISLPSLKEQQTIVRQLDALRAETQKLEVIYEQKLLNLEELKKSLLQKAFAGELRTEKEVVV